MTVNIQTELVNNGNSGWNSLDVMNALEKTFYNMGWNSGTQKDGSSASGAVYNGMIDTHNDATPTIGSGSYLWGRCGGPALSSPNKKWRYFYVTNTGTTSYQVAEWIVPNGTVSNNVLYADI